MADEPAKGKSWTRLILSTDYYEIKKNEIILDIFLTIEFKANYDSRLSEAEMEFENRCAEWETKMNRAKEDFNEEISTMISNHSLQLSNYRELHEAALDSLEREKVEMMEGNQIPYLLIDYYVVSY